MHDEFELRHRLRALRRVHEYNDTANGAVATSSPLIIRYMSVDVDNWPGLSSGPLWLSPASLGAVKITVKSASESNVTVSVCRMQRANETSASMECLDGVDNDWCVGMEKYTCF